jgi:hypothetical protein
LFGLQNNAGIEGIRFNANKKELMGKHQHHLRLSVFLYLKRLVAWAKAPQNLPTYAGILGPSSAGDPSCSILAVTAHYPLGH